MDRIGLGDPIGQAALGLAASHPKSRPAQALELVQQAAERENRIVVAIAARGGLVPGGFGGLGRGHRIAVGGRLLVVIEQRG